MFAQAVTRIWIEPLRHADGLLRYISSIGVGNSSLREAYMNEPIEQAVAIAIESYVHAPRTFSVLEVVRQVTAVFPDQDHGKIALGVRKSRRMVAADR
jgi:hypothetical protein